MSRTVVLDRGAFWRLSLGDALEGEIVVRLRLGPRSLLLGEEEGPRGKETVTLATLAASE